MGVAIKALATVNPAGALELLQISDVNLQRQNGQKRSIFSSWAEKDLAGAAAKAVELPFGQQRSQALQAVASSWAANDPQGSITWANSLANGFINSFVSHCSGNYLNAAIACVQGLPVGKL